MRWNQKQSKIKYKDNDELLMKLIKINGIEKPKEFFNPSRASLYEPSLLDNIDIATDKIIKAIKGGDKLVGISYDSDCWAMEFVLEQLCIVI